MLVDVEGGERESVLVDVEGGERESVLVDVEGGVCSFLESYVGSGITDRC